MKKIVFLTGAGMSAESGISTFRDSGGLWERYPVMQVASHTGWLEDPDLVTRFYNEQLRARLPEYGVRLVEIPRLEASGEAVSASRVRRLYEAGDFDAIRPLVPDCTLQYLKNRKGA